MLSLDEALQALAHALLPRPGSEQLPCAAAPGRVLAVTLRATQALPAFDASAMDGYAVSAGEPEGPLHLVGRVCAGEMPSQALQAGQAMRVLTGAPVPAGTWAVVPQEQVRLEGGRLWVDEWPGEGRHIRRQGSELAADAVLVEAGTRLRPWHLGLLASQGVTEVVVWRRPVVTVLSGGHELREAGQPLGPGQLHDANRPQLMAMLAGMGCEVRDGGIMADDPASVRQSLLAAADASDLVISSAGVSVGDADHVRAVLADVGEVSHWQVAIKPGKPFTWGRVGGTPFLGLPGNPVSAAVTLWVLGRSWVSRLQGLAERDWRPVSMPARLVREVANRDARPHFMAACWADHDRDAGPAIEVLAQQGSAALVSLARADVLVEVPAQSRLQAGAWVKVLPLHVDGG